MTFRWCAIRRFALLSALVLLVTGGTASAEIVFLNSGRTLSVKTHRLEGSSIVLVMRNGGEITFDQGLVSRIAPDEVPYPEDQPQLATPPVAVADRTLNAVPYSDIIESVAGNHGVDSHLVKALIQVESAYQPRARSRKGAMGLMQLMPATARQYDLKNPYDARSNIEAGIKHLKSLLQRFEPALALAAYNAGEAAVRRFGGIPPYAETRNYVTQILKLSGLTR